MATTLKRRGKADEKPSKTKKTKARKASRLDEKSLEAELERKYIYERFYGLIDSLFANCALAFIALQVVINYLFKYENFCCYIPIIYYSVFFAMCKYIVRYKGTEHEAYGKKLNETVVSVMVPIQEYIYVRYSVLATDQNQRFYRAMVGFTMYFLASLVHRIAAPRYDKSPYWCVVMGLIGYKYPRYGIFAPGYEGLAFFVSIGLGHFIGAIIDEICWRHYLYLQKMKMEHKRDMKRLKVLEDLVSGQESPFFEIIRR